MRKILPILLIICPYFFLFQVFSSCYLSLNLESNYNYMNLIPIFFFCLIILILIPNMIYAFILPKLGYDAENMLFWNMILKLSYIPLYVIIFLIGFFMLMMIFGIMLIPFLIVFDYLLLLTTSMYGISGLWQAYRKRKITKKIMIINVIMHFVFLLDVISSIVSYTNIKIKEYENE